MFGKLNPRQRGGCWELCREGRAATWCSYVDLVALGAPWGHRAAAPTTWGAVMGACAMHREVFSTSSPAPACLSLTIAPFPPAGPCLRFGPSFLPASSSAQRQGRLPGPFPSSGFLWFAFLTLPRACISP